MIRYNQQSISDEDIQSVVDVLKSGYLTTGPMPTALEKALIQYTGFKYGSVFNSATSALHCTCLALGINNKSIVWVPANTFVATANCVEYCNGTVDLIDIELDTGNICVLALQEKIKFYIKNNKKLPDALIVVHYAGQYCDLKSIKKITDKYGISLIEDASHALGAQLPEGWDKYRGEAVIFSFHPVKMITTGEGGSILSNNKDLINKARYFGNHGIIRDASEFKYKADGSWYYEQQMLGYNYRMNDMNAALGLSQIKRLDEFVYKRRLLAKTYENAFDEKKIEYVNGNKIGRSCYHLFPVQVDESISNKIFDSLVEKGIGVQKHYSPIFCHPYYKEKYDFDYSEFNVSMNFYKRSISIPLHVDLNDNDQSKIINEITKLCLK
jgi:UDP-4-amino-4,6-dideoxy-N-acetyl-beta-L-altrosamine transaminase